MRYLAGMLFFRPRRTRRFYACIATALIMALNPQPAAAWGPAGHRKVCEFAWIALTDAAKTKVLALLNLKTPQDFVESCTWADAVQIERPGTSAWHYVHIPADARTIDLARDCPQPASCVIEKIEHYASVLKDTEVKVERAEALKFLIHLVADLHQPLNVGIAADRGGRDIPVVFMGRPTTLFDVWERELLEVSDPPIPDYTPYLRELTDRYNRERWTGQTVRAWAQETLWVMRDTPTGYLGNPGGLELGPLYVTQNYPVAAEQVEKAGVRLAELLETALE